MSRDFVQHVLGLVVVLGLGLAAMPVQAKTKILALGDSLTAGFNLPADAAFPAVLERRLRAEGLDVEVVNAGVSGDTATGGLERLEWSLGAGADAAIVELGANDMLRGLDPAVTRKAIDQILATLGTRKIPVLLAGMLAAPALGKDYGAQFAGIYTGLAEKHGTLLYPFFLDGVAGNAPLNQGDGMHPTRAGVELIVERILPKVRELLAKVANAAPLPPPSPK